MLTQFEQGGSLRYKVVRKIFVFSERFSIFVFGFAYLNGFCDRP